MTVPYAIAPKEKKKPKALQTTSASERSFPQNIDTLVYLIWDQHGRSKSIPAQLANPLRRATIGITIYNKNKIEQSTDIEILHKLTSLLITLRKPKNATSFLKHFKVQINGKKEYIFFLQTLLHFCTLLDLGTYFYLLRWTTKKTSLLPLKTIFKAAHISQKNAPHELLLARRLFQAQFKNLLTQRQNLIPYKATNYKVNKKYLPDAKELGNALIAYINNDRKKLGSLVAVLNYLEMYDAKNIQNFLAELSMLQANDMDKLRNRAIEFNLINARDEECKKVEDEGIIQIVKKKFEDAAYINYQEHIKEGVEEIIIRLLTGSVAPWHRGHTQSVEMQLALMEEEGEFEKDSTRQSILLIAPVLSPYKIAHTKPDAKSPAQIGDLHHRIQCMIATLRNFDHVFITSQLHPKFVSNPIERVHIIKERITQQILKDRRNGKIPKVKLVRLLGAEKLLKRDSKTGNFNVTLPEPEYAVDTIVKGRRGFLAGMLIHLPEIHEHYPQSTLILNPGIQGDSSTLALQNSDYKVLSRVAHRIVNGYWDKKEIEKRNKQGLEEDKIYSVTEIYEKLKVELQSLISSE